jgi:hypothetical protein
MTLPIDSFGAPFASTFLILLAVGFALPISNGLPVIVPSKVGASRNCGDGDLLVAQIGNSGIRLNGQLIADMDVNAKLEQFYRTKAERVLFVKGEPNIALSGRGSIP